MINIDDFVKIGTFAKPHGVKGEVTMLFINDIFDRSECDCIICLIDGIPVPFFIESYRFKGNTTAIIKLEGVDEEKEAKAFAGREVYFPKKEMELEEEHLSWDYFIGFKVIDEEHGLLGDVTDVDESTINVLFQVSGEKGEILIPANEHLISKIDHEARIIHVVVPEGLLHL